ncbi:MAG: glycosyltransferase family 8 protein [Afipia sp.]|jgi:lipopolysaccharide biosynthesis glycosyltransferase|nr:glycosyltransferase family 8 protein [Afipia sp.]
MHIVSAADDNYLPHFCAMLHSAWLYHPQAHFYLLDSGISESNRARLEASARSQGIDLTIVECAARLTNALGDIPKRSHYARLLIPELLGDHERVLYLDADITITGPLDELFATDLQDRPFSAVRDIELTRQIDSARQGVAFDATYFNSGVLLIDIGRWKSLRITEQVFQHARNFHQTFYLSDQSALNAVLLQNYREIDQKWNFFKFHEHDAVVDVHVVHHTLYEKPWRSAQTAFTDLYKFHRDCTPWPFTHEITRETAPQEKKRPFKIARRTLLGMLGVKRHRRWLEEKRQETQRLNEERRMMDLVRAKFADPALKRAREMAQQRAG